MIVGSMTVLSI